MTLLKEGVTRDEEHGTLRSVAEVTRIIEC